MKRVLAYLCFGVGIALARHIDHVGTATLVASLAITVGLELLDWERKGTVTD